MPRVHVQHAVFVEAHEELPTSCPHCHAWFEDEDTNNLVELRMAMVKGNTSLVAGTGEVRKVLDGYDDTSDEDDVEGGPGKVVGYQCRRCREPVIWTHTRTWILEAMDNSLAAQLRTLLYDSNVLVEWIRKKVFGK